MLVRLAEVPGVDGSGDLQFQVLARLGDVANAHGALLVNLALDAGGTVDRVMSAQINVHGRLLAALLRTHAGRHGHRQIAV